MAAFSDKPWDEIAESDYADAKEFCAACLIDLNPPGKDKTKQGCKLPIKEPRSMGGRVNRNAVIAAAAVLAGGRGGVKAPRDQQRKAARSLVQLYREMKDEPPERLRKLAGD